MVRADDPHLHSPHIVCPAALSQANLAPLERQVDQAVLRKPECVCIDLSGVQAAESTGLEWLISTQSRLATTGIRMVLNAPSPLMVDVLAATRLDHRFQVELQPAPAGAVNG